MDLRTKIKQVLIDELHLDDMTPDQISDTAPLFGEGLGLDSLDALQLAVAIEDHFGVRVGDERVGKVAFASVDALASFIAENSSESSSKAAG
jgi:acyl carrier protein